MLALALGGAGAFAQDQGSTNPAEDANYDRATRSSHLSPRQRAEIEWANQAQKSAQAANEFLRLNRTRPGVVAFPSGVQVRVLKQGSGKRPGINSTVAARYQGKVSTGEIFDKSIDAVPIRLKVSGMLPGLQEAVLNMNAGAKWEIVIPPALGYGDAGHESVGGGAVLVYVFELVDVL